MSQNHTKPSSWCNTFVGELPSLLDKDLASKVEKSLKVINQALNKYEHVSLSFNGGKDSIVIFHLLRFALHCRNKTLDDVTIIHFTTNNSFKEMDDFINETCKTYKFKLVRIDGTKGIKEGLKNLLFDYPDIDCVIQGVRRTDPHGEKLDYFTETDKSWPKLMRVSPILDWSYRDVWTFLKNLGIPYCSLYDQGYTSLGTRVDTFPNDALKIAPNEFLPAWQLQDGKLERAGRENKKH
jgi:FAD synthetase